MDNVNNKRNYDLLMSYVNVLLYDGQTNKNLLKDLNNIKEIVVDWINDVEIDIEMMED